MEQKFTKHLIEIGFIDKKGKYVINPQFVLLTAPHAHEKASFRLVAGEESQRIFRPILRRRDVWFESGYLPAVHAIELQHEFRFVRHEPFGLRKHSHAIAAMRHQFHLQADTAMAMLV